MKKHVKVLLSILALGICGLAMNIMIASPAAATQNLGVTVANTPLPVQGTVSLGNTPDVNISNTPTVNVGNTPNVTLSGTAPVVNAVDQANNPLPLVVSPQGEPYADSCQSNTSTGSAQCDFQVIPTGKRLVIRFVSFESLASGGTVYEAGISGPQLGPNGTPPVFVLPLSNGIVGNDGYLRQVAAIPTAIQVENGAPGCGGSATNSAAVIVRCSITGTLVPAR